MKFDPVEFSKAIADSTRQKIMALVCCRWLSVNEVVAKLDVSQPTVSHHLAILREAGLVSVREEGKQTFYTPEPGARLVLLRTVDGQVRARGAKHAGAQQACVPISSFFEILHRCLSI